MSTEHTADATHFIGVGPEKTGTSWIHQRLKAHPDVYLPPVKEIRYLWERHWAPSMGVIDRFVGNEWYKRHYRSVAGRTFRRSARALTSRDRKSTRLNSSHYS